MKNPLCRELLLSWPTGNEYVKLYSWFITNCVFNSFLSITAIIFNCVTIKAVTTTSSLPKTLRTLLLSLAVSDLAVGLLAQPLNIVLLFKWLQMNATNGPTCPTYTTFIFIGILFSAASFFGVMALSVDRFLAIHFHLRYEELVTHKRVVSTVISLWVFSAILSSFTVSFSWNTTSAIFAPIGVSCLVISAVLYCKICFVVRRHKSQIHVVQIQQVEQDTEAVANLAVSRKSAAGAFYVYVVFLICYLPQFCSFVAASASSGPNTAIKIFTMSSWTVVFLNSSLNPIVYCWNMRHIRRAILSVLRSSFLRHN